ncbi:rho guanine nucleotide exchange factor 2-like isoform X1 [Labeo rohita]|uniref:Rho guanine nucleotide exchange factor 2-like isoform X1 n=1 Tax=Labeo rohita TaxID=84645 RepID=A0A498LE77_LABRO|nr:rho guanine nucleotide exchange factor 2-like isoform X1 [Labeo rohita]RXN22949.1 rho guanine nucleotide exchange factor 2-like isoform X1 [Labeo rohita]
MEYTTAELDPVPLPTVAEEPEFSTDLETQPMTSTDIMPEPKPTTEPEAASPVPVETTEVLSDQNKEKERKAREKETKERESRYSNGHLFTSLSVSATTLCSACNKSITAKEALSCPTCNVTIHNRCRDTLANCAKMKQKQQRLALVRNAATLHNVALRSKNPILKERPSSAIYPSETLRQSFLGSRKGRSTLSLNKSVSTNNIAGGLNDDSPVGLRRILSHSTDSLNFRNRAMSMESLNDEGEMYYASMLEELEKDGKDFEADSWSLAVDSSYLQSQRKDVIKRQDVIYELIQTEFNHVRTLRIMEGVFRRGMLEEVLMEMGVVHAIFPCLDQLLSIHSNFLSQLLQRRNNSLAPSSTRNFTIQKLGDILVEQFSGQNAEDMRKCYVEFCSRHLKAVKLYKELLARDKRFQQFIRRVSRGSLLRRHGVQECILLVTQRITKYPVLIKRILDNTKGSEEESKSLADSLTLIRELLCSVDQQVQELERAQRLQEIQSRLDPRAETKVKGGGVFGGGELLRRRLIHEGALLWKTAQGSRLKDVHVLLMTDILVFMQEKDQKYIFPCLDKPAVLCLQNLIVRDIANQERGMFLISHSTPPEMYELHAASKEGRNTWMKLVQQTVSNCPSREDFPLIETEDKALLRRLRDKGTISVNGTHDINSPSNKDRNGNQLQDKMLNEEVLQRLVNLSTQLHALQAAVIKQDSFLELYMQKDLCPTTTAHAVPRDALPESGGPAGTQEDLAELQRKYNLLQGEVIRLRATQDKTGDRAPNKLEKQLQELRLKDTKDTRDTLISQETVAQVDGMQETVTADSPRGNMRPASFS